MMGEKTGKGPDAKTLRTENITLWGIVQGVGFRPFVAKLAQRLGMSGEVQNAGGLARITLTDTEARIGDFLRLLQAELPPPAEIIRCERGILPELRDFDGFSISNSSTGDNETNMLPADLPVCDDCLAELRDPANHRWLHPFISCMSCGPRYTIIDRVPYDRDNTSMGDFRMCCLCKRQYGDCGDRRYHAQTISCHDCGPMLLWKAGKQTARADSCSSPANIVLKTGKHNGVPVPKKLLDKVFESLTGAENAILSGGVIALKGVGGYYFVCSPFDKNALLLLREIKVREEKPFAVMFANMNAVRAYCRVSAEEEALMTSRARPIVLLERRDDPGADAANRVSSISKEAYRSSRYMGAFLPAMGLQYMLTEDIGPLVMTSANLSDMPMIKDDEEMFRLMKKQPLIAGVLYNKRVIRTRMDDSVARVSDGKPQMIRRSKGYVPAPIFADRVKSLTKNDMIWATGGHLKSTFTLTKGNAAYVSRYFGDLDATETETDYLEGFDRMKALFRVDPLTVVCDLHPLYATTRMAETYANQGETLAFWGSRALGCGDMAVSSLMPRERKPIRLLRVQHHHAHIASVMVEHNLAGPVIGIAFDGTGYGTDGTIWGGEFLLCDGAGFRRAAHLRPVRMIGGDTSVNDGLKSALSYAFAFGAAKPKDKARPALACETTCADEKPDIVCPDISEILAYSDIMNHPLRAPVFSALEAGINAVESSSMGRLFDAVAALLGIHTFNRYEGECAVMLENAAARALSIPGKSKRDDLALKFHNDLAVMILNVCENIRERSGVSIAALSGGVFQNRILTDETLRLLRGSGFSVYCNVAVPPNDGGVSLGQAYIGMLHTCDSNGRSYITDTER
ncbi:MAG: carbamoyltransferase HypF [Clostridiales Family XIII bacterium]|jgi:hydrogenase maturation protein HypF|nr:carbamoyltransferase HypF [Clostridiales Family XIII bacterium]